MPFLLNCTNKNCGKMQEPYIDVKTDKVYCSDCNKEISNITYFAKVQMKALKQFKAKTTASFSVKCNKCGVNDRPKIIILENKQEDIVCGSCLLPLDNLSLPFKNMLKEKLKSADKDV